MRGFWTVIVTGVVQAIVGLPVTVAISRTVSDATLRDLGILTVWIGLLVGGMWLVYVRVQRPQPPAVANASTPDPLVGISSGFDPNPKLVTVANRTIRNERVPLDGYEYLNCVFEHVTLVYEGRTGIRMIGCSFVDHGLDVSSSPALSALLVWLTASGAIDKTFGIVESETGAITTVQAFNERHRNTTARDASHS